MKLQFSNYNIYTDDYHDNKNMIILNTRNGERIHIKKKDIFELQKEEGNSGEDIVSLLLKKGMIVEKETDEVEEVLTQKNNYLREKTLFLMILPTEQCNFRCAYCYESYARGKMSEETIDGIKKFVSENIWRFEGLTVSWFGGEPLLATDIIEELSLFFVDICKKNKITYYSNITTNGYFLTEKNWKILKKSRITSLQISIDGLKETHDKQRYLINRKGTWETIIENLLFFKEHIKTGTIRIIIRVNITKTIFEKREEIIGYMQNVFGNDPRFSFFYHLAQDWGNANDPSILDDYCDEEEFYEFLKTAAENGLRLDVHDSFLFPGSRICYAAKENAFVITSDGAIRKCTEYLYEPENYIANITEKLPYEELLAKNEYWNCIDIELDNDCLICNKLPLCYGLVCPAASKRGAKACGYDISNIESLLSYIEGSKENGSH